MSDASKAWNKAHPDKIRLAKQKYLENHPGAEAERMRLWRKTHPDKNKVALEKARIYKRNHRAQMNSNNKKWVMENPDKVKETRKRWREKYPEKYKEKAKGDYQKRRAIKLNAPGNGVSSEEWNAILEKYNNSCIGPGPHGGEISQDHVVPLSAGGSNSADNIQPLCRKCNSRKGTKTDDYRS